MSFLSYAADLHTKTSLRPSRRAIKRAALVLVLALGAAGAADFGYGYLTTGRYLESTDDAYVKADSTIVSPKVSGYIAEVLVGDNQPVKAGQLLARIDDRDFRTALMQAQASLPVRGSFAPWLITNGWIAARRSAITRRSWPRRRPAPSLRRQPRPARSGRWVRAEAGAIHKSLCRGGSACCASARVARLNRRHRRRAASRNWSRHQ